MVRSWPETLGMEMMSVDSVLETKPREWEGAGVVKRS